MMGIAHTELLQRTVLAVIAEDRRTLQRAELHDGGVEQTGVLPVQDGCYMLVKQFLSCRRVESFVDVQQSRYDTIDISVHRRVRRVVGKRSDSAGGIVANTGQRTNVFEAGREGRPSVGNDQLCGFVQVACAAVIA